MLVLGISGGSDPVYENRDYLYPHGEIHDSAAVLVDDGKVVAAIEEERLNRIKHTGKGAVSAIRFCLGSCGVRLGDIDKLVIPGDEQILGYAVRKRDYGRLDGNPLPSPRGLVHEMLLHGLGDDIDDDKICFIHHHLAHAVSAYAQSGFDSSLVFTMDGGGDDVAGMVLNAQGDRLDVLHRTPMAKSLGLFYLKVIGFLGYGLFDEYKVMGLAPYGDPERYHGLFRSFYELLSEGDYIIKVDLPDDLSRVARRRRKHEPFAKEHKDIAAALQVALEEITFHILRHFQKLTNQKRLCMAGGVAHNCTLNGKLLYSGMFKEIFVQPAAHDAGLAIGAALYPFLKDAAYQLAQRPQVDEVYWGTTPGDDQAILCAINKWRDLIEFEHVEDITNKAAKLIADGSVIGWVQGRSEFGPRALGNRSIVADPRPKENKDIINEMVKKRDAYRPFAPSVLEEYVSEFFDIPDDKKQFPFMTFVVKVRKDKQEILRATTHVDGTARIQTVSRQTNPRYWQLIDEFRKLSGIPVLLNTSFNNNVEPIVDSVEDAIACFLTTELHYLVIGEYLIVARNVIPSNYLSMVPSLPFYARLSRTKKYISYKELTDIFEINNSYSIKYKVPISSQIFTLLAAADGKRSLQQLLSEQNIENKKQGDAILNNIIELWARRMIILNPR